MVKHLEIPKEVTKGSDGRWYKNCPSCGSQQSYLRKNYAIYSFVNKLECKSCSNKKEENCNHKGWIKDVLRSSFLNKYKTGALSRGLLFDVEDEYLADLLIKQDFKCALTGWDINAEKVQNNTASLDRIDSSIGYVKGNVQWVHKMVNMCKQSYSQEEFIEMCISIVENIE